MAEEKVVQEIPENEIEEAKSLVWLSYLGILFLVPLLAQKDNRFAKFHAKQGMVLFFYEVAWGIIAVFLWLIFWGIAAATGGALTICVPLVGLLIFAGWVFFVVISIIGIIQAVQGNMWRCPLGVASLAEKFKF